MTQTSLALRWSAPAEENGVLLSYSVFYETSSGMIFTKTSLATEVTIDGLTPYTRLKIQVAGSTSAGLGSNSTAIVNFTSEGGEAAAYEYSPLTGLSQHALSFLYLVIYDFCTMI